MVFDLISKAILKFNAKPGMIEWIGIVAENIKPINRTNIESTPESIDKLARIFLFFQERK